ncbi:MAG: glycosyltransferase family A protein [Cyanobacteriota bacterium]|nr:glycosyltransferase family A protein [Cyanobacteriota bacterium]
MHLSNLFQVSVVIPMYNGELYIRDAIQSILDQDYPVLEVIVVDDFSTDQSASIVQSFGEPVHYVKQGCWESKDSASEALKQGIRLAQGNYLAFIDADDIWLPRKLSAQIDAMQKNPDVDMVFGHVQQFISPDLSEQERSKLKVNEQPVCGYLRGAMLINRCSFEKIGDFDSGFFMDWYARAQDQKLVEMMLPQTVLLRRVHQNNLCRRDPAPKYFPGILKKILDRRRGWHEN